MTLAKQIKQYDFTGGKLYVCQTSRPDIVSVSGSFLGGLLHAPNDCLQELLVGMLDQGTHAHSRDELHDLLESMGISMSFDCDNQRTKFFAHTLKDMWQQTIDLLYGSLTESVFDESCYEVIKQRFIGALSESKSNSRSMGRVALKQAMYDKTHPNYEFSVDESIATVTETSCEDVRSFYRSVGTRGPLIIVCVGDIDESMVQVLLERFGAWEHTAKELVLPKSQAVARERREILVDVPGKVSSDVFLAQPLYINRHHPDYLALMIGIDALGGNFAARLMRTVRDESGLTYGIYSSIGGVNDQADGYWSIWANYAPNMVAEGIKQTLEQCRIWSQGISLEDLISRVEGLSGKYALSLSSSAGIGSVLLTLLEQGYGVDYVDRYPYELKAITVDAVNEAINKHIDIEQLFHVISGATKTSD